MKIINLLRETLMKIAEKFNEEEINWAVGASVMLSFYDLVDKPNDIDILVDRFDIDKAVMILNSLGSEKSTEKTAIFSTEHFYKYQIDSIELDLMAGLTINYKNGQYLFKFTKRSAVDFKYLNGVAIPLSSLEDWYILYNLMGRDKKVKITEEYFVKRGISRPAVLEAFLEREIPVDLKKNIRELLG